jgi:hypothetical protein
LALGGTVNNQSGGTISGNAFGVSIGGGDATNSVTNAGGITGTGTNSEGVDLGAGGRVTNNAGGTIKGDGAGVNIQGGTGAVINSANIFATAASGNGVVLKGGGTVSNASTIAGGGVGVFIGGASGTVTNSGAISGTTRDGIEFPNGGVLTNQGGATIVGSNFGVFIGGGNSTNSVTNAGGITGTATNGAGVDLAVGGGVTNQSGGTIKGGSFGVYVGGGGAVTNAGTITGGSMSVVFVGAGTHTLTLQTGSTLNGGAYGSPISGATNAAILQGHGIANNNFTSFNTLTAAVSGTWTLGGSSVFGDTTVSTGVLSVTGSLTSNTLEILPSAQLTDAGAVYVSGSLTNSGSLTINGVTMHVAGAGGTFIQKAGGTTTLLNGGVLDPPAIDIEGGDFKGNGSMAGDVTVIGGAVHVGEAPGDSLAVNGSYSQTGGRIVFEIDPNGHGGFLETTLIFDPSFSIGISDTTFVYDFANGANANAFVAEGLFNLDTFLGLADGGPFCAEFDCGSLLKDMSFADNVPGLTITGFDPTSGALSTAAAPEPATWALMLAGFLGLGGLGLKRRGEGRTRSVVSIGPRSGRA